MEKIMELLKKIGASDDLANQICEELGRFDKSIHDKYEVQYKEKLSKAKGVCLEEVEKYKLELARKVELFLESKSGDIERSIDQKKAIEESEAMGTLRRVREITEGIEVADDAEVKALKEQVRKLTAQHQTLREEKARSDEAANRANAIAMDVIRENKNRAGQPVVEGAEKPAVAAAAKPITEGADKKPAVITEADANKNRQAVAEVIQQRRLKLRKPDTTRKTMVEQQQLDAPVVAEGVDAVANGDKIAKIAQEMSE